MELQGDKLKLTRLMDASACRQTDFQVSRSTHPLMLLKALQQTSRKHKSERAASLMVFTRRTKSHKTNSSTVIPVFRLSFFFQPLPQVIVALESEGSSYRSSHLDAAFRPSQSSLKASSTNFSISFAFPTANLNDSYNVLRTKWFTS